MIVGARVAVELGGIGSSGLIQIRSLDCAKARQANIDSTHVAVMAGVTFVISASKTGFYRDFNQISYLGW